MTIPEAPPILKRCDSGQCDRLTKQGIRFCCAGCRLAWESTPRWDVDGLHSEGCDQRARERAGLRTTFGR